MRWTLLTSVLLLVTDLALPDRLEQAAKNSAKIVDLTYPLSSRTPHWPGPNYSPFRYDKIADLEEDGVFSGKFCMPEHLGTHLDAPNHFEKGQPAVHQLSLEQLFAPAVVLDVTDRVRGNADFLLRLEDLRRWERAHGTIVPGALVFLYTGWGTRVSDSARYQNRDASGVMHFPGFSPEAARFLVNERNIKGLGIDTLSVDYGPSKNFQVHHIAHGAGKYHIENAANLDRLPPKGAFAIVAPIKIEGGSGGPVRVFALLP
ncbi:MAG: cyclase family protein [Acidobacteria bacterium]|nr:cyclase family protein [Acidobacteriota bacterium]